MRWLALIIFCFVLNAQEIDIQIIATTNLHGKILPQDTYTLKSVNQGWAKVASIINKLKEENNNTIIIDCGNATQGEPINYLWYKLYKNTPEPSMAIMNYIKYDAMVVGADELNQEFKSNKNIQQQANFPWLSANILSSDGCTLYTPYKVININDCKIGIVGLITLAQPKINNPITSNKLIFQDVVIAAKSIITKLRNESDAIIVAIYAGPGTEPYINELKSELYHLTNQINDISLILLSHTYKNIESTINGVPVLQPYKFGKKIGVDKITFYKNFKNKWVLKSHNIILIDNNNNIKPDVEVFNITAKLRNSTEQYLDTFATNLTIDLDNRWSRMESTNLMSLLHKVAREVSCANVTALSVPNSKIFIPKGLTSVRQFYCLYTNDDYLVRIKITGQQLKAYIEKIATFYRFSHDLELFNRNIDPEDFDTVEGCTYSIDISKPIGSRVSDIKINNQIIKSDQILTMCITSNRLNGAGGYLKTIGWNDKSEIVSLKPFRNILLEFILSQQYLIVKNTNCWRIIPYLDRERVLSQQPL